MTTQLSETKQISLRHIAVSEETTNIGAIINLNNVNVKGTVLSTEFQKQGGIIDLSPYKVYDNWKRVITGIEVPPIPVTYEMNNGYIAVLHPIAVRANIVLSILEQVKTGEKKFASLQKAIHAFYKELSDTIFGKNGVFNRWILGPRLKKSFRAVAVPGNYTHDIFGQSYTWVGIPKRICKELKINEGDIVVIGRDPTIWMGSLEFLHAYPVDHDAIEIHALVLPQLGGDHDGDQLWGYLPDQESIPQECVASFTRSHATWQKNFNDRAESTSVNWSSFSEDQSKRFKTTGLSAGPLDIFEKGRSVSRILDYLSTGKRVRGQSESITDIIRIASQLDPVEWMSYTHSINTAQLAMKIFMGPVGLLALRLISIGHANPEIRESANHAAERCAQGLLDAKHLTQEQARNFKPANLFKILNLQVKSAKTANQLLAELKKIVPCDNSLLPILEHIATDGRGVAEYSKQEFPLFEGVTSTASMDANGYMPPEVLNDQVDYDKEGIISYAFCEGLKWNLQPK